MTFSTPTRTIVWAKNLYRNTDGFQKLPARLTTSHLSPSHLPPPLAPSNTLVNSFSRFLSSSLACSLSPSLLSSLLSSLPPLLPPSLPSPHPTYSESVLALLTAVGVLHLVDAFYSSEDVTRPKPDGEIYSLVAANFQVPTYDTLMHII